jgi:hypothetical protein
MGRTWQWRENSVGDAASRAPQHKSTQSSMTRRSSPASTAKKMTIPRLRAEKYSFSDVHHFVFSACGRSH